MRVLLSTIGSRGDVQPLVALALALKALGQEVHLCVPPDFREWIEGLGMSVTPIGPELRKLTAVRPVSATPTPFTPEQRRQMMEGTIAAQFETVAQAAKGCDAIVGATALQFAAPSVAEKMGVPYVFAAFCPRVLPSARHHPIPYDVLGEKPAPDTADPRELWAKDAQRSNDHSRELINARRAAIGLPPIDDVRGYVITRRPWLASDPVLAPWPDPADASVFQTGAWLLPDESPLSAELERFLEAGEPPVYFGFGSIRATEGLADAMVRSARAVGRRAIVSRGWAELSLVDAGSDSITIGDVNQQLLFARVAAVVHHGGAGTTTAAARAGAPQVVIPQMYDQHYYARRVQDLGIGTAHAPGTPTAESLTEALARSLTSNVSIRARAIAGDVRADGARRAAEAVISLV